MGLRQKSLASLGMVSVLVTGVVGTTYAKQDDVASTINDLKSNVVYSTTVDPVNGDQNPYAVLVDKRPGSSTLGEVFVSNFSNAAGVNGAGTTVERIENGMPIPFFTGANGPAAMAFSPKGPLWIANFGQLGTDGNVQVTKPNGSSFGTAGIVTNSQMQGPWGQEFAGGYTTNEGQVVPAAFFVASAQNGTIEAMYNFVPGKFSTTTEFLTIGSGLTYSGTDANSIKGPQGMAWDANQHVLYVTNTADNSIRAYSWTGANTPNQGEGQVVFKGGPLKSPVGIALNPINGDLLVVNQGNNNLVELRLDPMEPSHKAHVVGQKVLDPTPVNPKTGAGSGLFGLATTTDANGNLVIYYSDDNTNTVNQLTVGN